MDHLHFEKTVASSQQNLPYLIIIHYLINIILKRDSTKPSFQKDNTGSKLAKSTK